MKIKGIYLLFNVLISIAVCQDQLNLQGKFRITINDTIWNPAKSFTDSLTLLKNTSKFYYHIIGAHDTGDYTHTSLRLPQTLNTSGILKQIVLYYNFLSDEQARERERLIIFPFFISIENEPFVTCQYHKGGEFRITVNRWEVIPVPPAPTPEEKNIYNKIVNRALKQSSSLDEIDEKILRLVASEIKMDYAKVKEIYQTTLLWQRSQ